MLEKPKSLHVKERNTLIEHQSTGIIIFMQIAICDRIWENVHSSHIRFCTFKGS